MLSLDGNIHSSEISQSFSYQIAHEDVPGNPPSIVSIICRINNNLRIDSLLAWKLDMWKLNVVLNAHIVQNSTGIDDLGRDPGFIVLGSVSKTAAQPSFPNPDRSLNQCSSRDENRIEKLLRCSVCRISKRCNQPGPDTVSRISYKNIVHVQYFIQTYKLNKNID